MLRLCLPQDSYIDITEDRLGAFKYKSARNLFAGRGLFLEVATQYVIKPFPSTVKDEVETYCVWMHSDPKSYLYPAIKFVLGAVSLYEIPGTTVLYIRQNIWKDFQEFLFTLSPGGVLTLSCNADKFLLQASYSLNGKAVEKEFFYGVN